MAVISILLILVLTWWPARQQRLWKLTWTIIWLAIMLLTSWKPIFLPLIPLTGCAWSWLEVIQIILVRRFQEIDKIRLFNLKVTLLLLINLVVWLPWQAKLLTEPTDVSLLKQLLIIGLTLNGLATVGEVFFTVIVNLRERWPVHVSDQLAAIIVLGAGLHHGQVSPILAARLQTAAQIWQTHPAAHLIVTGAKLRGEKLSEAVAMKNYLIQHCHLPANVIVVEEAAKNTWDNLRFSQKLLAQRSIDDHICLVTSSFHIWRVQDYCHRQKLAWHLIAAPTPWSHQPMAVTRDYLGIIRDHPRLAIGIIFMIWGLMEIGYCC